MGKKPVTLNIKSQHTNYNPEQEKIHISAIKELLASALFELYKKQ